MFFWKVGSAGWRQGSTGKPNIMGKPTMKTLRLSPAIRSVRPLKSLKHMGVSMTSNQTSLCWQFTILALSIVWVQLVPVDQVYGVTPDQHDDFGDLTTQGWSHGFGSSNPPVNVNTGGPAGAGDAFLSIAASGTAGSGSRLIAFNRVQWTGDYLSAGVRGIVADVNNFSSTAMNLRVAFKGPGGGFASNDAVELASNSGWQSIDFSLAETAFSPVSINGAMGTDFTATLGDVAELRLLSSGSPSWRGDVIDAELGADNLRAVVPEPSMLGLLAIGFLAMVLRLRSWTGRRSR